MHAGSPGNAVVCNYSCGRRMSNNERRKRQSWISDSGIPSVTIYSTAFHLPSKAAYKALVGLCFHIFMLV